MISIRYSALCGALLGLALAACKPFGIPPERVSVAYSACEDVGGRAYSERDNAGNVERVICIRKLANGAPVFTQFRG